MQLLCKLIFQTWQHAIGQYIDKSQLSEIAQKILSWVKWTFFAKLLPRIMIAYISWSEFPSKIIFYAKLAFFVQLWPKLMQALMPRSA